MASGASGRARQGQTNSKAMVTNLIQVQYCYDYVTNQIPLELLLYTHVPTALLAVLFGGYVLSQDRSLASRALAVVCAAFAVWCLLDLTSWFVFLGSATVMFAWSMLDLTALIFFVAAYSFLHAFLLGRDLPAWQKAAGVAFLLPAAVWTFLGLTLTGYDASTCEAIEHSTLALYPYLVEGVVILAAFVLAASQIRKSADRKKKMEAALASAGVLVFLGFFFLGTLAVAFLVNETAVEFAYNFEIYGLLGMPVLLGLLGYLIVRFQAFNLRIVGAQALSIAIVALIASEFAFVTSSTNRMLVMVTLVLTAAASTLLVRSVVREKKQRERIERLAADLSKSNTQLSEFMSLATHEIRNPATFVRGIAANILDGDLGTTTPPVRDAVQKMYVRAGDILHLSSQYLDKSKLELNQLTYNFSPVDLAQLVSDLVKEFEPAAQQRGIALKPVFDSAQAFVVEGDQGKLKEVVGNLIDNAIKYTPEGFVTVSLTRTNQVVRLTVTDSGVGIPAATVPHLFQKFSRADAKNANLLGTGLGLYLAKVFVEAHHGRIGATSNERRRGSVFLVELPTRQPSGTQAESAPCVQPVARPSINPEYRVAVPWR